MENSDSSMICISLCDIIEYFGDAKRPLRAGEEIVDAGWINALGNAPPPAKDRIYGLVMQTSAMSSAPHEIKLENLKKSSGLWKCLCSCKAGLGGKCKHIAACLLKIFRKPRLNGISSTELKQKWGKISKAILQQYSAIPVQNMCHINRKCSTTDTTVAQKNQMRLMLIEPAPNSELAKMKACYRSEPLNNKNTSVSGGGEELFKWLICHNYLKPFLPYVKSYLTNAPTQYFQKVVVSTSEAIEVCKSTMTQTSAQWLTERKIRITGSIAYNLYTYVSNKNPNWSNKLKATYNGNFAGNEATRYGRHAEMLAKRVFNKHYLLFETGLIISADLSFLAVSPDGIFFNGVDWK